MEKTWEYASEYTKKHENIAKEKYGNNFYPGLCGILNARLESIMIHLKKYPEAFNEIKELLEKN